MKNKIYTVFILFLLFSVSCNKGKTYVELLKEEKTAISRFIDQNDFVVLNEFPKDSIFGEKEFYKTSDGLYLNIINKGTPIEYIDNENIHLRYSGMVFFKNDTTRRSDGPITFMYNNSYSYGFADGILCNGIIEPLKYVGYEGRVKLIIPSKIGTSYAQNQVTPVYFEEVVYTTDADRMPK